MARVLLTLLATGVFLFAGLPMSSAWDRVSGRSPSAEHVLAITFSDDAGRPQSTPYFAVTGAVPGMEPQTQEVTLTNVGTVDVDFDIAVLVTSESLGPALADVLKVKLVRAEDDLVMYRGPLRGLAAASPTALKAGETVTFSMSISWGDGGRSDNVYQGKSLEFDLIGRARGRT